MKTIRTSVFETNSSSTHCVTLMTDEEFQNFKNNEALFNFFSNCPATWEDFYVSFKDDCKSYHVDNVPTLEEFIEAAKKFMDGNESPFEDNEDANNVIWTTCRRSGIYTYDGVADIEESERTIGDQKFHAVSAYVSE